MHAEGALDALGGLIRASRSCHRLVAKIDWQRLKALHETRRPRPLLSRLGRPAQLAPDVRKNSVAQSDSSSTENELKSKLANVHESARIEILAEFVATEAAMVMGEASTARAGHGFKIAINADVQLSKCKRVGRLSEFTLWNSNASNENGSDRQTISRPTTRRLRFHKRGRLGGPT